MAPKKTRKLVQKTVVEETTQDLDVPPEPMREEEQDHFEEKGRPMVTHGNSSRSVLSWNSSPRIPTTFQDANSGTL